MNILLDARLYSDYQHGISRYTYELCKGLSKNPDLKLSILVNKDSSLINDSNLSNVEKIITPIKPFGLANQFKLPKLISQIQPDIFHVPHFAAPVNQRCKTIITIHDLIHIKFAKDYSFFHLIYYNYFVKKAINNASHIITGSEFSKNDLIKWSVPADKITVIYNGIDTSRFKLNNTRFSSTEGLSPLFKNSPYILYVGNYKPHKNIHTLIKAFAILCQDKDFNYKLVLVGQIPKYVKELIFYYGIFKKVHITGIIDDDLLPYVYSNAQLFVFPSLYEGFGFPPLEAMACACPVIASKLASLPEILQDAAYYAEPIIAEELAKKIDKLLKNTDLQNELKQKGLSLVKNYSWDKTINETINVFRQPPSREGLKFFPFSCS